MLAALSPAILTPELLFPAFDGSILPQAVAAAVVTPNIVGIFGDWGCALDIGGHAAKDEPPVFMQASLQSV